jgi:hypothetical protein
MTFIIRIILLGLILKGKGWILGFPIIRNTLIKNL